MKTHNYYVYILTNRMKTVLYIGVTGNLKQRLAQHAQSLNEKSFTAKYRCFYLIYYEHFGYIVDAISREKELKAWRRQKKWDLIKATNPELEFFNDAIVSG